ncbi:TetR/AcrR family transcriptional regulator [Fulvivirgaceae bacterium BMA12]|uniref:TetR/AcrR family transcriptional regulator n=1 Tax=Agaribacillus aureus TaxID=3051825 RepID=A0ABT8LIX2_9BACT|nr:TetR/AcrR family transcriptional regulator [Fulvivirgaceae bacterium BMA12]
MTERKENIINQALKLFAENGYINTSTNKIARAAGVSEGLIFRHFTNKQGLLDVIVEVGLKDAESFVLQLTKIQDPREVLSVSLELPKYLIGRQREFWQLYHSLKYQNPEFARKYKESDLISKLTSVIDNAFRELRYEHPGEEAAFFLLIIGGMFSLLTKEETGNEEAADMLRFIKSKYRL